MRFSGLWCALFACVGFSSVVAQEQGTCDVYTGPNTVTNRMGAAIYVSGRARYVCEGGVSFESDSAFSAYGRRLLIGNVIYRDAEKTVTSQRLDQEERTGTLLSTGSTVVTDKKTGSVLRAPLGLTYVKGKQTSDQGILTVGSGKPHLTLYRDNTSTSTRDTTNIDSEQMTLIGSNEFHGVGNVVIKRGALNAAAGEAIFSDSAGLMLLWRTAKIKGESYTLDADSIHGDIVADVFKELRAFRSAHLVSSDLDVQSARLRIMFDSGAVHRMIALGAPKNPRSPAVQANAVTPDFKLTADSIDALAPDQKLKEVFAVGAAYAERAGDSLDVKLPDLIKKDWLRGDTVRAYFVEAPDSLKERRKAKTDSTSFDRVLERMIALGAAQPATAIFRVRDEKDTTKQVQVNYIVAKKITTFFKDGAVYDVNAEGEIKGMYLQPINVTPTPTTQATKRNGQ